MLQALRMMRLGNQAVAFCEFGELGEADAISMEALQFLRRVGDHFVRPVPPDSLPDALGVAFEGVQDHCERGWSAAGYVRLMRVVSTKRKVWFDGALRQCQVEQTSTGRGVEGDQGFGKRPFEDALV